MINMDMETEVGGNRLALEIGCVLSLIGFVIAEIFGAWYFLFK